MVRTLVLALMAVAAVPAQDFEVASVKWIPMRGGEIQLIDRGSGGPGTSDPGTFRCANCRLVTLFEQACRLRRFQFDRTLPLPDKEYQIQARIPPGTTPAEFRLMLQNLLKARFHLQYHFVKRAEAGYLLVVDPAGQKLKASTAATGDGQPGAQADKPTRKIVGQRVEYHATRQTAADIARMVVDDYAIPVEDATGLTGAYDIDLTWVFRSAGESGPELPLAAGPTFFEALQSQLGLKLKPAKVLVDFFVVDHVDDVPVAN